MRAVDGWSWIDERKRSQTESQVIEMGGRYYWMSYALAAHVAILPGRRRKVWLGRNWRRARPLVKGADGSFRVKSGMTDL